MFEAEGGYFTILDIKAYVKNIPKKLFYKDYKKEGADEPVGLEFEDLENPDFTPDEAFS